MTFSVARQDRGFQRADLDVRLELTRRAHSQRQPGETLADAQQRLAGDMVPEICHNPSVPHNQMQTHDIQRKDLANGKYRIRRGLSRFRS